MSLAEISAVNSLLFTYVVERGLPSHCIVEVGRNLEPFTVSRNAESPALASNGQADTNTLGGSMVSIVVCVPLYEPVRVAIVTLDAEAVLTGNVAVFVPAGITTAAGTSAATLLLESVTAAP